MFIFTTFKPNNSFCLDYQIVYLRAGFYAYCVVIDTNLFQIEEERVRIIQQMHMLFVDQRALLLFLYQ